MGWRRVLTTSAGVAIIASLAHALLAQAPAAPPARASTKAGPPRLVVILVVDQMRADYIDRYQHQWTAGLKRIVDGGALFTRAAYPYAGTMTCAGFATISTGIYPWAHGIPANEWFDHRANRLVPCFGDPGAAPVAFGGGSGREFSGPRNLKERTFADELRKQSKRKPWIVSVALKPRSAIALAGKGSAGTIAVWEEDDGTWATSTAYTRVPWPAVDEFVKAHPIAASYGEIWARALPADRYLGPDDGAGEASPPPWGPTFPYPLVSESGKPDGAFVTTWERSPWSDAYVADLGRTLAEKVGIGQTAGGTDLLALAFPSTDTVGHQYGPLSHEVQDVLIRLDAQIGKLLDTLDKLVGPDHYVVALTGDHGVAPLPEQLPAAAQAGRLAGRALVNVVDQTLSKAFGPGTYVAAQTTGNIYLKTGVADRIRARPGLVASLKAALLSTGAVGRVFWADELTGANATSDPVLDAWRLSYVSGRSGDIVIVPKRNWVLVGSGTTHGSPYEYDQRVPLVFYGAGVRPGRYASTASPADIAPTLATLIGIRMPRAQGWALTEAIAR